MAHGGLVPLPGPLGGALPGEAEGVQETTDVVPIVPDAPAAGDEGCDPGGRPERRLEAVRSGPLLQEAREGGEPVSGELGRPARGGAGPEGPGARPREGLGPAVDRLATHPVLPGDLGLREPPLQVARSSAAASLQRHGIPPFRERSMGWHTGRVS